MWWRFAMPWVCGVVLLAAAAGCGTVSSGASSGPTTTWTMHANPKLPAAEGNVKVRIDAVGDHVVEVSFQRLAAPGQAFGGATIYMVWIVPRNAPPQPIGGLDVDDALNAKVTIKTPNENFDVLVTAEVSADVAAPSRNRAFDIAIRTPV
jgi:hypothetical protein